MRSKTRDNIIEDKKVSSLKDPKIKPPATVKFEKAMKMREKKEAKETKDLERIKMEDEERIQKLKKVFLSHINLAGTRR